MTEVVYTCLTDGNGARGTLFNGCKFWLSRKVPQRSRFIAEVQANGGEVLPSERQADILIVDHARKEALPGTYSYQFIEISIRNGRLERLDDYAIGPPVGTIRAVGSSTQPAKIGRQKFTHEDDRILRNWVKNSLRDGARTEGNEIYKQLQAKNPRHPWQSWRDRWIKYLRDEGSRHSASDYLEGSEAPRKDCVLVKTKLKTRIEFSEEDMKILLDNGEVIRKIPSENVADAWKTFAHERDEQQHTAQEWQEFWEESVLPIFLKRANRGRKSSMDSQSHKVPLIQKQISKPPTVKSPVFRKTNAQPVFSPFYEPQSPEIPLASESSFPDSIGNGIPNVIDAEEPKSDPPGPQEIFYPAVEALTDLKMSPKRKRAAIEDDFPSSSPPYLEASNKRQRRQEGSLPAEIAPTPEQSPIHTYDFSSLPVKSRNAQQLIGSRHEIDIQDDDEHDNASENENEHLTRNRNRSELDEEDNIQEDGKILGRQASPVISEPNHKTVETETSLNESTPFVDFDVAPPEDGWDESLSASPKSLSSLPSLTYQAAVNHNTKIDDVPTIVETQTLLPDFSVPAPDGGWDTVEFSPSEDINPPPPASPTQSEIPDLLDAWIDEHVAAGFPSEDVLSALECASLDKDLAEIVLRHMKRNQGRIPLDIAGVWTKLDDERLESTHAQRYTELQDKHGKEHIQKRWDFLNECRNS